MEWLKLGGGKNEKVTLAKEETESLKLNDPPKLSSRKKINEVDMRLKQLLVSSDSKVVEQAEDWLLTLGDEKSLLKIKNRLSEGNVSEREKAAQKLALLSDASLLPILRNQLQQEKNPKVQFELAFAIWRLIKVG